MLASEFTKNSKNKMDELGLKTQPKKGIKTTEFWMSTAAALIGILYASGVIAPDSGGDKALGLFASILASMGYTISRGMAKKQA
jgi:hypothetical protein